jgi:transposase
VIPTRQDQRRNPHFDKEAYRRRNAVERCVSWLKESRRLATRHEKLAVNVLAMVKLAMIRRCLLQGLRFAGQSLVLVCGAK